MYDVTAWLKNKYNTYCPTSHEVKASDNEIWSVNRIQQHKYFTLKIMQKMRQED